MKLIEKKCPNCGANLKFDKDDKEVSCKYCNASYEIQRDPDLNELINNVFNQNDFILHRKMVSNFGKVVIILSIIIFIFIFVMFFITFLNFPRFIR